MTLNLRETATILAALRNWQQVITSIADDPCDLQPEIFCGVEPLCELEIDELCQKINTQ